MNAQPKYLRYIIGFGVGSAAIFAAIDIAANGRSPDWAAVLLFGTLFCIAEHQYIQLDEKRSVSASFILVMAAVVVLRRDGTLLGPLIVGMFAGIFLPSIKKHAWLALFFNFGVFGLAMLAGAAVYEAFPTTFVATTPGLLLAALVSAFAVFALDYLLIGAWIASSGETGMSQALRGIVSDFPRVFPFGLIGGFLGALYLSLGPIVLPLFVAPVLIARQTFSSYLRLRQAQEETAQVLISALEVKDHYTAGHVGRVAKYAVMVGEELKFPPRQLERLHYAALMHDIGKLLVPNYLLNKPGKLTEEEFARVREHEDVSVDLLERIDFLAPVASSASGQFSKYNVEDDGDRKRPIEPHIVHVADAYDAMTSTRSYRKALEQEVAFAELRKHAGTQFHPQVVEALLAALERRGEVHGKGYEEDIEEFDVAPPEVGTGSAGLGDLAPDQEAVAKQRAAARPADEDHEVVA
jgi:hypothetical protein